MSETPAPTMLKTCVQCKGEFETHLFTALNFKSGNDVTEKCFLCRRMVAVNDFIKANAVQSRLSVRAQEDHVLNQENAIFKWSVRCLPEDIIFLLLTRHKVCLLHASGPSRELTIA